MFDRRDTPVAGEFAISRRGALAAMGAAGILAGGAFASSGRATPEGAPREHGVKRVLRFAHMTDVHVQPEKAAGQGFAAALNHMQSHADRPEMAVFGGDNVMNVDSAGGADRAAVQLDTWNRAIKNDLSLPFRTCVGNHDVLRLNPTDGKKWAVEAFALTERYYFFDHSAGDATWRIIMLDSTSPEGGGYKGRLDDEQFEWLTDLLADTPSTTHVAVVSHIPIVAACAYFDGNNEKSGDWVVPGSWMHIDARRILDLFGRHRSIRLCLSGHEHMVDEVRYKGVSYCCNGAVSGAWWDGKYNGFDTGYGLVDLYADGSFRNEYVEFPWEPRA